MPAIDHDSTPSGSDLRSVIARADAGSRESLGLREFWSLLLSGRVSLTYGFSDERRHFLTFKKVSARGLAAPRVRYLERCLLGEQRKLVAADVGLSQSTIASGMSECLRGMGLDVAGSRVPMLLVVAAHASRGEGSIRTARLSDGPGTAEQMVSIPRPDSALESRLSAAELGVVRMLAEGQSYSEIARQRGTSVRTVANQMASVFHKLEVSGRSELLHYIVLAYDGRARDTQAEQSRLTPRSVGARASVPRYLDSVPAPTNWLALYREGDRTAVGAAHYKARTATAARSSARYSAGDRWSPRG